MIITNKPKDKKTKTKTAESIYTQAHKQKGTKTYQYQTTQSGNLIKKHNHNQVTCKSEQ